MSQDLHNSNFLGRLFYVVANFPALRVDFGHSRPFRGAKEYPHLVLSLSIQDCGVSTQEVLDDLRAIISPQGYYCDYQVDYPFIKVRLWL